MGGHKMKDFLKKASIYILLMFLVAGIIFGLNYYYGQKISEDVEAEIAEVAANNNYQLRLVEVETNPLMHKIQLQNLNISRGEKYNLNIVQAEINLSWQQFLNYIRKQNFELDKNLETEIRQLNYSNLKNNYQLNFKDAELFYEGDLTKSQISQLSSAEDLHFLLEDDHNLIFKAAELKYDFPYYRSWGLNNEDWNRLSTFNNFVMRTNYSSSNQLLNVEKFNLSGDILKLIFNFKTEFNYNQQQQKIIIQELRGDYDFLLAAEDLNFEANSFFEELKFKQFDFNGSLNLSREEKLIKANQLDFNLNLNEFKILLAQSMSQQINQNSLGILAADNKFEFLIDRFSYQQDYSYPNGSSQSELDSSLIEAELEAEYNYSREIPYISSAILKYKTKTDKIEQLNNLLQLALGKSFDKDKAGYYRLEFWGDIDDLNFE